MKRDEFNTGFVRGRLVRKRTNGEDFTNLGLRARHMIFFVNSLFGLTKCHAWASLASRVARSGMEVILWA
jgi:hypothetical protein